MVLNVHRNRTAYYGRGDEGDGQSHKTVSTNHNLSEEKGEPKRYRAEALLLTSLKPFLNWAMFVREPS